MRNVTFVPGEPCLRSVVDRLRGLLDRATRPIPGWLVRIGLVRCAPLPSGATFLGLTADCKMLHVTRNGIQWDHIRYQSEGLASLRRHPDHREWKGGGSLYLVRRDPFDLGHVYVGDPCDGERVLKVPATRRDYADRLTAHQHALLLKAAARQNPRTVDDVVDLPIRLRTTL